MDDTRDVRVKLMGFWEDFTKGRLKSSEARIHIGFGRAVLDSLKVEIAAAHLNAAHLPPVSLGKKSQLRAISGKRAA